MLINFVFSVNSGFPEVNYYVRWKKKTASKLAVTILNLRPKSQV